MPKFEKGNPYRFQEGHGPNGAGRPKGAVSIKDTIRKYMEKKVKDVDPVLVQQLIGKNEDFAKQYGNMKVKDAYSISLIRRGLRGDFELLRHLEGNPPQPVDLDANVKHSGGIPYIDASGKLTENNEAPIKDDGKSKS